LHFFAVKDLLQHIDLARVPCMQVSAA
jgi:hypothetical protein